MKKIIFLSILLFLTANSVSADEISPEWLNLVCPPGMVEETCSSHSEEPFGPEISNDCDKYENNYQCTYLVGNCSSFGCMYRYCCQPGFDSDQISPSSISTIQYSLAGMFIGLFATLLLELPIFLLFGFRNKRSLLFITLANVISVSFFHIAGSLMNGLIFIIAGEIIIFIFEVVFLTFTLKKFLLKRIILATLTANVASAVIGTLLAVFINRIATYLLIIIISYLV